MRPAASRCLRVVAPGVLVAALALVGACPKDRDDGADRASGEEKPPGSERPPEIPEQGPLAQKILYEQGKSLLRAGKPAAAVKVFRRAIRKDPGGPMAANAHLGLGSALGDLGRHAEAVKAFEKVVALRPNDPEAYRALAIGQEDAGQLEAARQSLEQVLALDADQLTAYQDLASLYLRGKDLEGAKKAYVRYEMRRAALIQTLGRAKSAERRAEAARALGEARDESTAKALGLALDDKSKQVRLAVIRALGQQGLEEGAGPLRQLLEHTSDPEEQRAIQLSLKAIARTPQPSSEPPPAAARPEDAGPAEAGGKPEKS